MYYIYCGSQLVFSSNSIVKYIDTLAILEKSSWNKVIS